MSDILQHTEDGVLTITFNREARKNSLNRAMYSQLAEIFRSAANDKQVRVAVLQGAENIFTAGNDIADAALFDLTRRFGSGYTEAILALKDLDFNQPYRKAG